MFIKSAWDVFKLLARLGGTPHYHRRKENVPEGLVIFLCSETSIPDDLAYVSALSETPKNSWDDSFR